MPVLLATKLHRPSIPFKEVERARLIQSLNDGLASHHPLTLVSAPAGFGKTTCISTWINTLGSLPVAWLSLDAGDNDPARFFSYFFSALQTVDARLGQEIGGILSTGQLPPAVVIAESLLREIQEYSQKFLLVLDDFHHIQNDMILRVLEKLIANAPAALHLIIITREDPPLPLARLRAHALLTEVRALDLRFTPSESDVFLNEVMSLGLSLADVAALEERTEGWVVGLQLAGLSLRGRPDRSDFIAHLSGIHRYILGYLIEEVLNQQPEEVQIFLLQTSILDKLNGDLCDAITQRADSGAFLERLYTANLFLIPLDDDQHWYRYHHLFANLLANRLKQTLPANQIQELHRKASDWLAENDMLDDAIQHALLGQDYERVISFVERAARTMMFTGRVNVLKKWLEAVPEEYFESHLFLKIYRTWIDLIQGKMDLSEPSLLKMETMLRSLPPSPENIRLRNEMIVIISRWIALAGNTARAIRISQEALDFLPEEETAARARVYSALSIAYGSEGALEKTDAAYNECLRLARASANYTLAAHTIFLRGMWLVYYGKLHEAARTYQSIIDMGIESGQKAFYPAGQGLIGLASIDLEWHELEKAEKNLTEGMDLCEQAGLDGLFSGCILKSRLHQARGNFTGALEELQAFEKAQPRSDLFTLMLRKIQVLLAMGNSEEASRMAMPLSGILNSGVGYGAARPPIIVIELVEAILIRVYLAQGKIEQAFGLIDKLQATAEPAGRFGHLIEVHLLRALALQKQHRGGISPLAIESIRQALTLAEPEGYQLLFAEAGPPAAQLLNGVIKDANTPDRIKKYAHRLLNLMAGEEKPRPAAGQNPPQTNGLIELLTDRELEVLRLIAEGLKYEEIAERLFISLNTVRTYVKGIYSKLDVNNRSKAVAIAQQQKII